MSVYGGTAVLSRRGDCDTATDGTCHTDTCIEIFTDISQLCCAIRESAILIAGIEAKLPNTSDNTTASGLHSLTTASVQWHGQWMHASCEQSRVAGCNSRMGTTSYNGRRATHVRAQW
eukprot:m.18809 g.18809  ORF g.18809 m.18809 type:complete len:118 (+) comp11602_c0_seq2:176-529(+)